MTPEPFRVPKIGRSRIFRALELLGIRSHFAVPRETARLEHNVHVDYLLTRLMPLLYERHWTDKQLWFMLEWPKLQREAMRNPGLWPFRIITTELRRQLIWELRVRGYEVQEPLPPQTDSSVLICWRANIYTRQQ